MPSQRAVNSPLCIIVPPQGETLPVHVSTAHSRCSFQFAQALPGSLPVHRSLIFSTSYGHSRELLLSDSCVSQPETWVPSKESPFSSVLACPSLLPPHVLCCWLLLTTPLLPLERRPHPPSTPKEALLSLLPPSPLLSSQQPQIRSQQ